MTALIFFVAIAFRLSMLLSGKSLWGDEFFSIALSSRSMQEVIWGSILDNHPPLYYLLLHFSIKSLGYNEISFRLVSFLASIGTLHAAYLASKRFLGRDSRKLLITVIAISSYFLQPANEIRNYSLFSMLTLYGFYFLTRSIEKSSIKNIFLFCGVSVLALHTHHFAWIWFSACVFYGAYVLYSKKAPQAKYWFSVAVILLLSLPTMLLVIYHSIHAESILSSSVSNREYLAFPVLMKKTTGIFWHFSVGYVYAMLSVEKLKTFFNSPFFLFSAFCTALSVGVFTRGMVVAFFRKKGFFWLTFAVFIVPTLLLLIIYPVRLGARFIIFAAPFYWIAIFYGLQTFKSSLFKFFFGGCLLLVNLAGSVFIAALPTDAIHRDNMPAVVRYVVTKAGKDDVIVGFNDQLAYYSHRLKLPIKARILAGDEQLKELAKLGVFSGFVWYLSYLNMHETYSDTLLHQQNEKMTTFGFEFIEKSPVFGSQGGQSIACRYVQKS